MGHHIWYENRDPDNESLEDLHQPTSKDGLPYFYMTSNWSDMPFYGRHFHGRSSAQLIAIFEAVLKHLEEQNFDYVPRDPDNRNWGWGSDKNNKQFDDHVRTGIYMTLIRDSYLVYIRELETDPNRTYWYTDQAFGYHKCAFDPIVVSI